MANIPVNTTGNISSIDSSSLDLQSILPQILEKFVQVIEASLILVISVFVIRYIRKRLQQMETEHAEQKTALNLMEKITSGFIIVIAITIALKIVGIDISLLVSVSVLGLSYGLQDIIKNYVAGILILFKAPFKIGDIVKIKSFIGKVAKMDFQSTAITTFDNRHITIYNKDIMTQSIVNYTKNDQRRLELDITIGYGSDTNKALETFNKILAAHPKVLKSPKFSVIYKKFSDVGTTFTLKFWVQRPCNILKIRTDIAAQITSSLDEQEIFMPFYKGIEVSNEAGLQDIAEPHKKRSTEFFTLPIFTSPIPAEVPINPQENQPLTPGQQAPTTDEVMPDFEEPE